MNIDLLAECHKALGDKTRLQILALLKEEELCVCELVEILNISQPAVSQHMRRLRNAKLVRKRRQGQWVFYSLDGEVYPFMSSVLKCLPDMRREIDALREKGLKVQCRQ